MWNESWIFILFYNFRLNLVMEGNTSSSEILPQFTDTENMVYLYDGRTNNLRK